MSKPSAPDRFNEEQATYAVRGADAPAPSPDERCSSDEQEAVPSWLKLYRDGWEDAWASPAGLSQVHSSVIVLNQNGKLYVSS